VSGWFKHGWQGAKDLQNLKPIKHNCGQSGSANLTNLERGMTELTRAPNDKPSLLA